MTLLDWLPATLPYIPFQFRLCLHICIRIFVWTYFTCLKHSPMLQCEFLKGTVPRDFRLHIYIMNQLTAGVFGKLPPVSLALVANFPPYQWHKSYRWKKFTTGNLPPVVHPNLWISSWIFEKFEMTLLSFPGAWGRWFLKKIWSKKSHDTVPLRIKSQ